MSKTIERVAYALALADEVDEQVESFTGPADIEWQSGYREALIGARENAQRSAREMLNIAPDEMDYDRAVAIVVDDAKADPDVYLDAWQYLHTMGHIDRMSPWFKRMARHLIDAGEIEP